MKPPVKKRTAPSKLIFILGAVMFYITAIPISLWVDNPLIFALGYTCSIGLFLIAFIAALYIRLLNLDDYINTKAERRLKEIEAKKNKDKGKKG